MKFRLRVVSKSAVSETSVSSLSPIYVVVVVVFVLIFLIIQTLTKCRGRRNVKIKICLCEYLESSRPDDVEYHVDDDKYVIEQMWDRH